MGRGRQGSSGTIEHPFWVPASIHGVGGKNAPVREGILKRNAQTVKLRLAPGQAVPSAKIAGGACPAHCGYSPPLVKAGLLDPGTVAAFHSAVLCRFLLS